jgi:peptide/nickel transport system permease protein
MAILLLIGGLAAATLVRFAPGFDSDEQQLDSRLSSESVQALRAQREAEHDVVHYYVSFLNSALHGEFGQSRTLNRPVRELMSERLPVTARLIGIGLLSGWSLGLLLAFSAGMVRLGTYDVLTTAVSGLFLCVPSAALALIFVYTNAPASLAVALIVFAHVFRYWRNLLSQSYRLPHIITARAKGLGSFKILLFHILPVSAPQLFAVAGISVSVALGAAIPVEALCGVAGIGQLAWQAALGRDLPLLVTLTFLVAAVTLLANTASDLLGRTLPVREV